MEQIEYSFWFWSHKLAGILRMIYSVTGYNETEGEFELIMQELRYTNDEENRWVEFNFSTAHCPLEIKLAYDAEDGHDMIHIRISTTENKLIMLKTLDIFQSQFKSWDIDN